jgi:hypothetical protein
MQLVDLPCELLRHSLSFAVDFHPRPADVLTVNRLFHSIAEVILYERLIILSTSQLKRCVVSLALPRHVPKNISLRFSGRDIEAHTFSSLADLLRVLVGGDLGQPDLPCFILEDETPWESLPRATSQLTLDALCFCMHSFQRVEYHTIFYALSHAK